MSEFAGFDLDRSTARAWSKFQARLADRLAEMCDEDSFVIATEVADEDVLGATPYIQFAGFGSGTMVCAEVSSNDYLAEEYELDDAQCDHIVRLGWTPPEVAVEHEDAEPANFVWDLPRTDADRLAVLSVTVLREVFGVAHPAFLSAGDLVDAENRTDSAQELSAEHVDEAPPVTMPESHEHLCALVDATLAPLFGAPPQKDDDGDIPVPWGSSLVFIRVLEEAPIVQLFSIVAEDVTDLDRAGLEVNILNRDVQFIKFILVGNRVLAQLQMPAWPFVPEHLRSMLTGMSKRIDEIDEDLTARIGGRRAFEPADDVPESAETVSVDATADTALDTTLLTLIQLDAEGSGALDPTLAASVCHDDQDLIVRLLRQTEEQEISWRKAANQARLHADTDEAAACDHEMVAWERTTALLRRTLRLVVEHALGRERGTTYTQAPAEMPPRTSPHLRRATFPPQPPHLASMSSLEGLFAWYRVSNLVELDQKLSANSRFAIEVFDRGECIEVRADERVTAAAYPFTVADFHQLLAEVGISIVGEADGE